MATPLESAWAEAIARSPPERKALAGELRKFLADLDNAHAQLLTDRPRTRATDAKSAELLEFHVAAKFGKRRGGKYVVADCLRLVHEALRRLDPEHRPEVMTRLLAVTREESSPFAPDTVSRAAVVDQWRSALEQWIRQADNSDDSSVWQVATLASAVLHGALLDQTQCKHLWNRLRDRVAPEAGGRFRYYDFHLAFQGLGNQHHVRWFADPVTDMLLARTLGNEPALATEPAKLSLNRQLRSFFLELGIPKDRVPRTLAFFLKDAATWWIMRAAPIDIQSARRNVTTHSIHARSWQRIIGVADARDPGDTRGRGRKAVPEIDQDAAEDFIAVHPWLADGFGVLSEPTLHAARQKFERAMVEHGDDPLASVYLGWLGWHLAGRSSTRRALSLKAIRSRWGAACPLLAAQFNEDDPSELKTEDLEDRYAEIASERDPAIPIRDVRLGIREFHSYLVARHGKDDLGAIGEVLGDETGLLPVDANLISFDDYQATLDELDRRRAEGADPDDMLLCKLLLLFTFRLGLRRMEALGLRLIDIHREGSMVCLIRPHDERGLKTPNARRNIPLAPFLDDADIDRLNAWLDRREDEEKRQDLPVGAVRSPYVFALPDRGQSQASIDGVVRRLVDALRVATGDSRVFIHHLRHAFGTWVYLRLRSAELPGIGDYLADLPITARLMADSRPFRVALLGPSAMPTRAVAYAVARLLGHSSPAVSMGHYIHGADLVLAAITRRETRRLKNPVLIAASGLPITAAYALLKESPEQLARKVCQRHQPADTAPPEKPMPAAGKPGRPRKIVESPMLPFASVRRAFDLAIHEGLSVSTVAEHMDLSEGLVAAMFDTARAAAQRIDLSMTSANVPVLPGPRYGYERGFFRDFEGRVGRLWEQDPHLCERGAEIAISHFNRQKLDVVFRGRRDKTVAGNYLSFLFALGYKLADLRFTLRSADLHPEIPGWFRELGVDVSESAIRTLGRPVRDKTSYEQWIGIQVADQSGRVPGKSWVAHCLITLCAARRCRESSQEATA